MHSDRKLRRLRSTTVLAVLLAITVAAALGLQRAGNAGGGTVEVSLNSPAGFPVDI